MPMGDVADEMVSHLEKKLEKEGGGGGAVVDMKVVFQVKSHFVGELLGKIVFRWCIFQGLSLDSISNCAFGISTNSFENPDNELFQVFKQTKTKTLEFPQKA